MTSDDLTENGFYFNVGTGQVEKGMVSSWSHRMGPYATQEEAAAALEKAKERTQEWDEADREWESD